MLWPWLLLSASACSVADNLSYGEITAELDGIVRTEGAGATRRLVYAEHAPTSAWYMRSPLTLPLRFLLGALFGVRHESELENPSGHVRELLVELPDETGSNLSRCGDAVARFCLIAELDPSAGNRIVALDGACSVIAGLGIGLFEGPHEQLRIPADPSRLAAARTGVRLSRPENRQPGAFGAGQRQAYADGLRTLVDRPLETWAERAGLVADLVAVRLLETDDELRPLLDHCLREALRHCLEGALLQAVQGRDSQFAELRICATQQVRRFGGPRAVPLLLATMADFSKPLERFDPDPLVQLQLIHLCGQLRGELALTALRLPGREAWEVVAPADFLARTVLDEQRDYYSHLRVPAWAALSLCLGRPRLDYDIAWVESWVSERQRKS